MPRRADLKPQRAKWTGASQWKIDVPASLSPTGKRERSFFETKQDAEDYALEVRTELKNHGTGGVVGLSPVQLDQARVAFSKLEGRGVTLNEVVADWITRADQRESSVTFAEAGQRFRDWLEVRKIKGRAVSASYQRTVRQALARFSEWDSMQLTEIDARRIAKGVEGSSPSVRNALLAVLSALFTWAGEVERGWVKENPCKGVKRGEGGAKEVETFENTAVKKALTKAVEESPDLLAYHVFGFFAGIRPDELKRMAWEHVDIAERHIVLPAGLTKTGERRVIEIDDTLAEWLAFIVKTQGIQSGPIVSPVNLRRRLRALRDDAKVAWIQDGMRHTYASAWLAANGDEHKLRANLGHKSSGELWDHYHRAMTKREAAEFWKIKPPKGSKIVKFKEVAA